MDDAEFANRKIRANAEKVSIHGARRRLNEVVADRIAKRKRVEHILPVCMINEIGTNVAPT